MGQHRNRLDAKGRVSVPASFRAWLRSPERAGVVSLVLSPSLNHACIEGTPLAAVDAIARSLEQLPTLSAEQDELAAVLCGSSQELETDKEGRIVLPESLAAYAGIGETALFIGLGGRFHIWEPEAGERFMAESRAKVRASRLTLAMAPALPVAGRAAE